MSRRLFWFVAFAAGTTAVAIADSVIRNQGKGFTILPDDFQTLVRVLAIGLWMLAGIAVATREVINHVERRAAKATEELLKVIDERTREVLKVVDHRKKMEIDAMFRDIGLAPKQRDEEPAIETGATIQLSAYRRRGRDWN